MIVVVPGFISTTTLRIWCIKNVVFDIHVKSIGSARIMVHMHTIGVRMDGVVIHLTGHRTPGILALERSGFNVSVDDVPGPGDIGGPRYSGVVFNVKSLRVGFVAESVMNNVAVHHNSLGSLHVYAIV